MKGEPEAFTPILVIAVPLALIAIIIVLVAVWGFLDAFLPHVWDWAQALGGARRE